MPTPNDVHGHSSILPKYLLRLRIADQNPLGNSAKSFDTRSPRTKWPRVQLHLCIRAVHGIQWKGKSSHVNVPPLVQQELMAEKSTKRCTHSLRTDLFWMVVSTLLKSITQNGNLSQVGVKIKKMKPPPRFFMSRLLIWHSTSSAHLEFLDINQFDMHSKPWELHQKRISISYTVCISVSYIYIYIYVMYIYIYLHDLHVFTALHHCFWTLDMCCMNHKSPFIRLHSRAH